MEATKFYHEAAKLCAVQTLWLTSMLHCHKHVALFVTDTLERNAAQLLNLNT